MKFNIKNIALGLLAACLAFAGCQEEISPLATAVQTEVPSVTFEAQNAQEQVVNLFADGDWMADVPVEWITVTPMSGRGNTEITISVTDNVKDGAQDSPRSVVVRFRGASIEREGKLTVNQKGDTYLGVPERTLTEVAALDKDEVAKIAGAHVVAVAADGFILTDGTTYMFAQKADAEVAAGDKLFLNGTVSATNGFPSFVVDEYSVVGSVEVNHPTVVDLTAAVDSYEAKAISYVKIEGTIVGNAIKNIPGTPAKAVNFHTAPASLGMEAVSVHKVLMHAYHIGLSGGAHQLVVVSFKDNGTDDTIGVDFPFKDDFIWLDSYIAAANAVLPAANQIDDVVAKQSSSSDGAANLYTTLANNGCNVLGELRSRGYTDLNPGQKTIYLQNGYLKFGKTDAQSGLTLPLMKIEGEQDIAVQFQWCAHITGSGNVDKTELVVAIEGPGTVETVAGTTNAKVSDPIKSKQDKNQMFWQDVTVKINGATSGTFITIRPKDDQMGTVDKPKTGQFRYHLDNINVLLAADLVPAHMEVNGVEDNLITFEGTPEGPASFEVLSDKEFTVQTNVDWLSFNQTSGPADMPTVIEVTCAESELSELRKGEITVKSGTSVYKIQVVQSAAGTELSPFVSLVGGNAGNVSFEAGSFSLGVQANVEYEYSSDAAWVKVEPAPATKAKVEVTDLVVTYEANSAEQPRTAHIRVYNAKSNVETVYTLTQAAYESGIYFQEDFTWVAPWADAYGSADSVGDDNPSGAAPNVYTQKSHLDFADGGYVNKGSGVEGYPSFLTEFANRGYVDINSSVQALYTQKYYLKLGKGSCHTGIKLPPMELEGATATDVVLTFDWSAHMTGSGNIDKVKIVVELEGDGVCGDSRAKISNPISPDQAKGDLKWQPVKMTLKGVTSNTRIIIRPTHLQDHDGITQQRWYIDNIKVAKKEPVPPIASFPFPKDPTFTGTGDGAGTKWNLSEGWILSEDGKSKLSAHKADGTPMSITYKWEASSDEGKTKDHVRALATGFTKGGYWLFEVPVKDMPAGYYTIKYNQSSSNTGANYFLLEVSVDGKNWAPVDAKTSSETYKDGSNAREVTYTYALNRLGKNAANIAYNVEHTYAAPALPGNNTLYIRAIISDDMEYRATKALASSGTNRIWGPCEVIFEE